MCGLIAAFNTETKVPTGTDKKKKKKEPIEPVNEYVVNQYENQAARGKEGFGIVMIGEEGKINLKRATGEVKFLLDLYKTESSMIIAHHRNPTSTKNQLEQTHPILVSHKELEHRYLVIHNGIVGNATDLKERHEKVGFKYITETTEHKYDYHSHITTEKAFNDTEAIAIEIALFIENKVKVIGTKSSAAFIVIQLNKLEDKAEKIFFGRNGGSLNMSKTRGKLRLSSQGEGSAVKDLKLYSFEIKDTTMNLKSKDLVFEEYKKPVNIIMPTKEEFTKNDKTLSLPFRAAISRTLADGSIHAAACPCKSCEEARTKEEEKAILDAEEEITYEAGGKTHADSCQCHICKEDDVEIPQNNIIQTEEIDLYDEKFIDEEITRFESEIRDKSSKEISEILDENLENILDKISEIAVEYKSNLVDEVEMENEINYSTQMHIFLDTMKAITEIAIKERAMADAEEEAESYDTTNKDDNTSYEDDKNIREWHPGLGHRRGHIGFSTPK